jgi:hypothetical protein
MSINLSITAGSIRPLSCEPEEEEKEGEEVGDANEPAVIMALCNPCPVCMKEYTFKKLTQHPTAT